MRPRDAVLAIVLSACCLAPAAWAQPAFTFTVGGGGATGRIADLNQLVAFAALVTNTGDVADTYTVTIAKDLPPGWIASLCQGTICYAPFVVEISFSLAPGAETNLDVDLTAVATAGEGSVEVTVTSGADPQLERSERFLVITPGPEVLLVDGDGPAPGELACREALAATGRSFATWPRHSAGSLSGVQLGGFPHVVWFSGARSPGLDDGDRGALAYYVQHGGALFLSGPDLAREVCDPAGAHYSAQAAAWFAVILGTGYAAEGTAPAAASGPAGDPFTGGLSCALQGPAGLNTACDELAAVGSGTAGLLYGTGAPAAVRATYGAGRTFFCGFALEDIAAPAGRTALLQAFLAWSGATSAVAMPPPAVVVGDLRAAPNPCNPRTVLGFTLAEGPLRTVAVDIFDLRGRVVRRLLRGELGPGPHAVPWSGDSDSGRPLASGTYLVRVEADGQAAGTRITLSK